MAAGLAAGVMRLLAISWCLPPMLFPRALQVARLLGALKPIGWDATVVTVDPESLQARRPRDPELAAAHASDYERVLVPTFEDTLPALAAWRFAPWLQWMPDTKRFWVRPAARAALRAIERLNPDVVVSFAQPWSDHLAGLEVKRRSGLPWVAHFSDPWSDSPYFGGTPWQHRLNARYEAAVVREADAIVFVSQPTADLVMRKYPRELAAKVTVLPHMYVDAPDAAPASRASGPLRLVYTGNLFAGRAAGTVLDALAAVTAPVHVTFVGQVPSGFAADVERRGLSDRVAVTGPKPFADARRACSGADVLLVIDAAAEASVFLPSKLIEYLAFRRPILGVTPETGASAGLIRRIGGVVVPPDRPPAIAEAIEHLAARQAAGTLAAGPQHDAVAREFAPATIAARFDALLKNIARPPISAGAALQGRAS